MLLGLSLFEWAWCKVKPIREINEERDSKYPAYRRIDAKNWKKWKFYFGAVTFMPLRFFLSLTMVFLLFIFVK